MMPAGSGHRCKGLRTMENTTTARFGMQKSWVIWRRRMKGTLLEMGRKRLDSKMERRDRRTARSKGRQRGKQKTRGKWTGIDMMKQRHLNIAGDLRVRLDTQTGKMTAVLGERRERKLQRA